MRAVIQRVEEAEVTVAGATVGEISKGLLVLLAIEAGDGLTDLAFLKKKILNLRVLEDEQGKMNLSLLDAGGSVLMVSQFTLYAILAREIDPVTREPLLPLGQRNFTTNSSSNFARKESRWKRVNFKPR